jgi:hypothetical protein
MPPRCEDEGALDHGVIGGVGAIRFVLAVRQIEQPSRRHGLKILPELRSDLREDGGSFFLQFRRIAEGLQGRVSSSATNRSK